MEYQNFNRFVPKKWLEVDTSPQIKKFGIGKLKSKNRLQLLTIKEIKLFNKYMGGIIVPKELFSLMSMNLWEKIF